MLFIDWLSNGWKSEYTLNRFCAQFCNALRRNCTLNEVCMPSAPMYQTSVEVEELRMPKYSEGSLVVLYKDEDILLDMPKNTMEMQSLLDQAKSLVKLPGANIMLQFHEKPITTLEVSCALLHSR